MKTVDIIIPSYKPGKEFLKLIGELEKQDYPINQIFIINTEERYWNQFIYFDKDALNVYKNIKVAHHSKREFDHARSRHKGFRNSNADIVICMTQDAMPADLSLIGELVRALDRENAAVAYARQLPAENSSLTERLARTFNYPEESAFRTKEDIPRLGIKTFFCSNVCAAYRKDVYDMLGGFTGRAIFNEDMVYAATAIQAGYGIAYAAEAKVIHSHNYSNRKQFHRNFDLGVSQAQHPEVFRMISSEKEGLRFVRMITKTLLQKKKFFELIKFYSASFCKLLGFQMGKRYQYFPLRLVRKWSDNKEFWG